tara:strand:- start:44 stop:343 length:300 start_codon:yes stop_codon:yes gene_type:complete
MKITKETLKQIIKEELQNLKEGEMTQMDPNAPHEDDMTAGEYYASSVMGLPYNSGEAAVLDELSAAIGSTSKNGIQPKDILAFVQQVLGDAQSDEIIDV